jgi:photosystem II stability/assembly factor-like uncharacterized protein
VKRIVAGPWLRVGLAVAVSLAVATSVDSAGHADVPAGADTERSVMAPLASRSLLLDGAAADGLMVVVGERGHILLSQDEGSTWRQASVPTRSTLTAVFLLDRKLGWAVGHDATIVRTRDGGETWEKTHSAPQEERPFLDVWFADRDHGLAIGAYGLFMRTADGGATWTPDSIAAAEADPEEPAAEGPAEGEGASDESGAPASAEDGSGEEMGAEDLGLNEGVDFHLNAIARAASGRLYIAAESGKVYRSDDGGLSWVTLPSPYDGSFFGILPLEGDSVLVFGLRGHLYRSEDAGQSWAQIESSTTAMLTDARRLTGGSIAITGLAGTLLLSGDGGRSFELRQQPSQQGLSSLIEAKDGHLVLIGEFGVYRRRLHDEGQPGTPAPGEGGRSR